MGTPCKVSDVDTSALPRRSTSKLDVPIGGRGRAGTESGTGPAYLDAADDDVLSPSPSGSGVHRGARRNTSGSARRRRTGDSMSGLELTGKKTWWQRWRRTIVFTFLIVVALVVSIAGVVLWTINSYFGVYRADMITLDEVTAFSHPAVDLPINGSAPPQPKIPRIIHQTWKTEVLPERWVAVRESCERLHPTRPAPNLGQVTVLDSAADSLPIAERAEDDGKWEYMLWTDESSRAFIEKEYSWFLPTFDGYRYGIQRADVIRYFVLHKYGGVYMDLDIGCTRPMDSLLYFDVILPITVPVGVSNDLMFASPRHPFMELVIHSLISFDHSYGTNYPTVMFSTGPMALSAIYGLWRRSHPMVSSAVSRLSAVGRVRILPQALYGKNTKAELVPLAFFSHYYGSSWHTDDSGFILWLGSSFRFLLWLGASVAFIGLVREGWAKRRGRRVGPLRRAAEAVVAVGRSASNSRRGSSHAGASSTSSSAGLSGLPVAFEGWAQGPDGGRLRRLRRGELFFLPAYWLGGDSSSRPSSPGGSSGGGWTSYLPLFGSASRGGAGYVEATTDDYSDSDASNALGMTPLRRAGNGWWGGSVGTTAAGHQSGVPMSTAGESDEESLPSYAPPSRSPLAPASPLGSTAVGLPSTKTTTLATPLDKAARDGAAGGLLVAEPGRSRSTTPATTPRSQAIETDAASPAVAVAVAAPAPSPSITAPRAPRERSMTAGSAWEEWEASDVTQPPPGEQADRREDADAGPA